MREKVESWRLRLEDRNLSDVYVGFSENGERTISQGLIWF